MFSNVFSVFLIVFISDVICFEFSTNCGNSRAKYLDPNWRIFGGQDALEGEYPWQAILASTDTGDRECGGSIINENWILTAGHCVIDTKNMSEYYIRLGVHNMSSHESSEVNVNIENIYMDDYIGWINDIALIKLKNKLDFNGKHKHLEPICLATHSSNLTDNCFVTGFGGREDHKKVEILQKVFEPSVDSSHCLKLYKHFNTTLNLCAGGSTTGGTGFCKGDSGGPLQCLSVESRWHQTGIVSYNDECGKPNVPDVYTKVSEFVDWIKHIVSTN